MCASNHNLWRNYTLVGTRCRGTLDLSPDICKTPNRRVAVTSPATHAPRAPGAERAMTEGLRVGCAPFVGRLWDEFGPTESPSGTAPGVPEVLGHELEMTPPEGVGLCSRCCWLATLPA